MNAADALKYAAAKLRETEQWTSDAIGGSLCDSDHETELGAIESTIKDIEELAAQFTVTTNPVTQSINVSVFRTVVPA